MKEKLPNGWIDTTIGDISDYIQRGKGPKYTDKNSFPVVNQKAVRWFGIQEEHLKYVAEVQWDKWTPERFIREEDILWNSTGTGTIGRACFIDALQAVKAKVVDSHVTIVRTNSAINSKYVFYWIMHPQIQGDITGLFNGSTNQVELSKTKVLSTELPLSPLPEQKRIVSKLDQLLAQVAGIQSRLDKLPALLKRFRQSVLAAAVSGKLTEEWARTFHFNETSAQLKTRWLVERVESFEQEQEYLVSSNKIKRKRKFKEPDVPDVEKLNVEIPTYWQLVPRFISSCKSADFLFRPSKAFLYRSI